MDKKTLIFITEALLIIVLSLFLSASAPVGFGKINIIDEGQFASWSYQMSLGKLPYKDIYITYGPLSVYPLYALFSFFGNSLFLLKLYFVLGTAVGSLLSLIVLRDLGVRFIFRLLGIVSIVIFSVVGLRHLGGVLALYISYKAFYGGSNFLQFILGVVLALTFLVSPDIGIFSFFIITFFMCLQFVFAKNIVSLIYKTLLIALGGTTVFICFYLIANSQGWFGDYLNVTADLFMSYSGQNVPNGKDFPRLDAVLAQENLVKGVLGRLALLYWEIIFYISFCFFFFYKRLVGQWKKEFTLLSLLTFFGICLYSILLTRYGHFYFTLAPLIIVSLYFCDYMTRDLRKRNGIEKILLCLFIVLFLAFYFRLFQIYRFEISEKISYIFSGRGKYIYGTEGYKILDSSLTERTSLAQRIIQENTDDQDLVFFLSDQPLYYYLTKRQNPTRFDLPFIAGTHEKRSELLSDIKSKKPKIIIFDTKAWSVDEIDNKRRLPEVMDFIRENYKMTQKEDGIEVYMAI